MICRCLVRWRLQVIGYKLQVTGYKLQVTSYKLQVTSYKLQATSYKLQATRYTLQATSYKLQVDLTHEAAPLRLGMVAGHRFTITLRDLDCDAAVVEAAAEALTRRGFPNYFGLQARRHARHD